MDHFKDISVGEPEMNEAYGETKEKMVRQLKDRYDQNGSSSGRGIKLRYLEKICWWGQIPPWASMAMGVSVTYQLLIGKELNNNEFRLAFSKLEICVNPTD